MDFELDLSEGVATGAAAAADCPFDSEEDLAAFFDQNLAEAAKRKEAETAASEDENAKDSTAGPVAIFDIETGPFSDDILKDLCPPYEPPLPPGEFDPSAVKVGNCGAEKAAAKIEEKRLEHLAAVKNYESSTKAAREGHFAKFKDKAALSPTTGKVLAIGWMSASGEEDTIVFDDERKMLDEFWSRFETCADRKQPMIGHNILNFDLPFLVKRSWILGVSVPQDVRNGRYWHRLFIDTMDVWACGSRDYVSLDTLGKLFGCGKKTEGFGGGDFSRMFLGTPEDRKQAMAYLHNDLTLTLAVAKRLGLV